MKTTPAVLLEVVALLEDITAEKLVAGQVGTIVEILAPDVFEVEFCDKQGRTLDLLELRRNQFLVLRHEPAIAA